MTLWPALIQLLQQVKLDEHVTRLPTGEKKLSETSLSKKLKLDFEHTKAVAHSDYVKPFQPAKKQPLGETPALIIKSHLRRIDNKQVEIELISLDGAAVKLTLTQDMLHNFCNMLIQVHAKTDWHLTLTGVEMADVSQSDAPALH